RISSHRKIVQFCNRTRRLNFSLRSLKRLFDVFSQQEILQNLSSSSDLNRSTSKQYPNPEAIIEDVKPTETEHLTTPVLRPSSPARIPLIAARSNQQESASNQDQDHFEEDDNFVDREYMNYDY